MKIHQALMNQIFDILYYIILIILTLRAVLTIDPYYDSFYYHLPFASRVAGLCPESCYRMNDHLEMLYEGFPKLFNELQGLVWKLAGSPQVVDLLNLAALTLFGLYLWRWFKVPPSWTLLGLLAVPLIQIHVTSTYIDLPLNLAASVAILSLMALVQAPEEFGWPTIALLVACLTLIANSKLQMLGVAGVLGLVLFLLMTWMLARRRRVGPFAPRRLSSWLALLGLLAAAGTVIGATGLSNLMTHGNPFYPVEFRAFGFTLPGPWQVMQPTAESLSDAWQLVPSPIRWMASVLEIGTYEYRQAPWTYDQGYCTNILFLWWEDCWLEPTASFRMGGYFVPYVLFLLAFLGWQLHSRLIQERRWIAATLLLTTVFVALLPHSHELRYYQFWIIVLVALCLITVFDPRHNVDSNGFGKGLLGYGMLIALASVVLMTEARYITPTGPRLKAIVSELGIDRKVASINEGELVCIDPSWQPFTILFAAAFHPSRHYTVQDGMSGACSHVIGPR